MINLGKFFKRNEDLRIIPDPEIEIRGIESDQYEEVLIVDPSFDNEGKPTSSYWFAELPAYELLKVDKQARSRYTRVPKRQRIMAWIAFPLLTTFLTVMLLLFTLGPPVQSWLPALVLGALFGWMPGLLAAWLVIRAKLQTVVLWAMQRTIVNNGSKYAIEPITPSGLISDYIDDRVIVIRADYMKRVGRQDAARRLYRIGKKGADKVMFASLVVIALGLFALIFLVQAMIQE